MNRQPVKSSFIAAVGYDAATQMLEVEFKSGKIYQYLGFPPEEFAALRSAESLGAHYNRISRAFTSRRATELENPEQIEKEFTASLLNGTDGLDRKQK